MSIQPALDFLCYIAVERAQPFNVDKFVKGFVTRVDEARIDLRAYGIVNRTIFIRIGFCYLTSLLIRISFNGALFYKTA